MHGGLFDGFDGSGDLGDFRSPVLQHCSVPLLVRLRPNRQYLALVLIGVTVLAIGLVTGGGVGMAITAGGAVLVVLLGYPIVVSTLLRVPVIAVQEVGIRFPLMGPRLPWTAVADVKPALGPRPGSSLLLVVPVDPAGTLRQVRPWLRREARANLVRYGTPLVLSDLSLDRSLDEIAAAVRPHLERRG
jgi:hypothetical protein